VGDVAPAAARKLTGHCVDLNPAGLQRVWAWDDVVRLVLAHDDVQRVACATVVSRGPTQVQGVLAGGSDVDHIFQPGHGEAALAVELMIRVAVIRQNLHV